MVLRFCGRLSFKDALYYVTVATLCFSLWACASGISYRLDATSYTNTAQRHTTYFSVCVRTYLFDSPHTHTLLLPPFSCTAARARCFRRAPRYAVWTTRSRPHLAQSASLFISTSGTGRRGMGHDNPATVNSIVLDLRCRARLGFATRIPWSTACPTSKCQQRLRYVGSAHCGRAP